MRDFARSDNPEVQRQLDRLAKLSVPQGRLGLETIRALLARLGDPHRTLPPVFHVAGTNGKGSTCAFLRAMMEAQGLRVHATTSPHLVRYNERIRVAGKLIDDARLASLLGEVLDAASDLGPSFFEVTIAASFLEFARVRADACIVEVGLGGRFDATNVIEQPAVCGIASLGLDHERFLLAPEEGTPAPPLARIAFEKSGIAKPGAPLVTLSYPTDAQQEIHRAAERTGARLAMRDRDWTAEASDTIAYRDAAGSLSLPLPAMEGPHQLANAALAVAMVRHQDDVRLSEEAIAQGVRTARLSARLQRLDLQGPLLVAAPLDHAIVDGGHNPDAAMAVAEYLARSRIARPLTAVIGMLAGKDWRSYLRTLAPHFDALVAVPVAGHDCGAPGELAAYAETLGIARVAVADTLESAIDGLPSGSNGTLLIGGSLYLAGEALRLNAQPPD